MTLNEVNRNNSDHGTSSDYVSITVHHKLGDVIPTKSYIWMNPTAVYHKMGHTSEIRNKQRQKVNVQMAQIPMSSTSILS